MKKFYFIESINGGRAYIVEDCGSCYMKVSIKTGQQLQNGYLSNLEGYKIINPFKQKYELQGSQSLKINPFEEFLLAHPEYIIIK